MGFGRTNGNWPIIIFATAKSYLTSSLFTITYYFAKNLPDGFSEKVKSE